MCRCVVADVVVMFLWHRWLLGSGWLLIVPSLILVMDIAINVNESRNYFFYFVGFSL